MNEQEEHRGAFQIQRPSSVFLTKKLVASEESCPGQNRPAHNVRGVSPVLDKSCSGHYNQDYQILATLYDRCFLAWGEEGR
eukprot:CAMPEP_0196655288 /NCGR_PEP_ID=MMETSP1086-20130531/5050_1 /TAXON_ID=77921 /ORGANISM="Cyanoptyche  gloeocystis , Strain SAG4.97" /LENGTH=80 /DNA_ID=CAMNT_0041987519 /DNA_START=1115 /DNA_END=1355 /DNA_ORIENTATION=-